LRVLMDHGSKDSITGDHLRCAIKSHKLELGVGQDLF
jgi:hypothetical protein